MYGKKDRAIAGLALASVLGGAACGLCPSEYNKPSENIANLPRSECVQMLEEKEESLDLNNLINYDTKNNGGTSFGPEINTCQAIDLNDWNDEFNNNPVKELGDALTDIGDAIASTYGEKEKTEEWMDQMGNTHTDTVASGSPPDEIDLNDPTE